MSFENCVLKNVEKKYDWEKNKERKTMKETKQVLRKSTAAIVVLVLLLFSSSFVMLGTAVVTPSSIIAKPITTTNYGDIMQYDWPLSGQNEGHTSFNPGPAPDKPDVLWSTSISGSGVVNVFDGKAFVLSGKIVRAYDALTGASIYNSTAADMMGPSTVSGVQKLDSTYMLTYGRGFTDPGIGSLVVRKIATGEVIWGMNFTYDGPNPGSWHYFDGQYSASMKKYFTEAWDPVNLVAMILAYDLSDPSKPATLA